MAAGLLKAGSYYGFFRTLNLIKLRTFLSIFDLFQVLMTTTTIEANTLPLLFQLCLLLDLNSQLRSFLDQRRFCRFQVTTLQFEAQVNRSERTFSLLPWFFLDGCCFEFAVLHIILSFFGRWQSILFFDVLIIGPGTTVIAIGIQGHTVILILDISYKSLERSPTKKLPRWLILHSFEIRLVISINDNIFVISQDERILLISQIGI